MQTELLNTEWVDARAAAQDARQAQYDALADATTVDEVLAALPMPEDATPMQGVESGDWQAIAIESGLRALTAEHVKGDWYRAADGQWIHSDMVERAIDGLYRFNDGSMEQARETLRHLRERLSRDYASENVRLSTEQETDWMSAEDRSEITNPDAWVDYRGSDRMTEPSGDWLHERNVGKGEWVETDLTEYGPLRWAATGTPYRAIRFGDSQVNLFGKANLRTLKHLQGKRVRLHLTQNGQYWNAVEIVAVR